MLGAVQNASHSGPLPWRASPRGAVTRGPCHARAPCGREPASPGRPRTRGERDLPALAPGASGAGEQRCRAGPRAERGPAGSQHTAEHPTTCCSAAAGGRRSRSYRASGALVRGFTGVLRQEAVRSAARCAASMAPRQAQARSPSPGAGLSYQPHRLPGTLRRLHWDKPARAVAREA